MTPMVLFCTYVALIVGAVWALTTPGEALVVLLLGVVGFVIGLAIEGRINLVSRRD